jgi:hypothetical protein
MIRTIQITALATYARYAEQPKWCAVSRTRLWQLYRLEGRIGSRGRPVVLTASPLVGYRRYIVVCASTGSRNNGQAPEKTSIGVEFTTADRRARELAQAARHE